MYKLKTIIFLTVNFFMNISIADPSNSCINFFRNSEPSISNQLNPFVLPLESLAVPQKTLYHQVPKRYSLWLSEFADSHFMPIPEAWVGLGEFRFIWTSEGKKFYSRNNASDFYDTFQIRIKSGWRFAPLADIMLPKNFNVDSTANSQANNLAEKWLIANQKRQQPLKNDFSIQMIEYLEEQGYISHSAFYLENNIAGHYVVQKQNGKNIRVFVIVIPQSAEFRPHD